LLEKPQYPISNAELNEIPPHREKYSSKNITGAQVTGASYVDKHKNRLGCQVKCDQLIDLFIPRQLAGEKTQVFWDMMLPCSVRSA
jgi:hypothetical protein